LNENRHRAALKDQTRVEETAEPVAHFLLCALGDSDQHRVVLSERPSSSEPTKASSAKLSLALPDKPSIAVLPFQNMSGDPDQEYFADGMVEEIITALSRIRWLFVIARPSRCNPGCSATGCALDRPTWSPVKGSSARVSRNRLSYGCPTTIFLDPATAGTSNSMNIRLTEAEIHTVSTGCRTL